MKNVNTLVKSLATVNADALASIVNNENVDCSLLTENEKLSVLVFAELEKALKTKNSFLTLDCNYAQSKNTDAKVDYFRLVSNDTKNQSMIQVYCKASARQSRVTFAVCTSCAKVNREQFEALESELHFTVKRDKKTNRAKTSQRTNIAYDDIVSVIKSVCAVLDNSATAREKQPEDATA